VNAIRFMIDEIDESAWGYSERYRTGQDIVVGVNKFEEDDVEVEETLRVDPASEKAQVQRLKAFKEGRDQQAVEDRLTELRQAAEGSDNLLPHIRRALKDNASLGEVCAAMRDVFGSYKPEG
jgi:methylmalonyl-CoA mutase N-terminal domain/subunit